MMKASLLVALLALGCTAPVATAPQDDAPPGPALPGPEGARAFADLEAYYRDKSKAPSLSAAIQQLASEDPERRRSAGRYLHALLAQLYADESNGRAVWTPTGWWGGGSESPSRDFRSEIARTLASSVQAEEALEAADWLLSEEKSAENQVAGLTLLKRIQGPRAAKLLGGILRQPHPNGEILAEAIAEVDRRGLRTFASELALLAAHHRGAVRAAARTAAALPPADPQPAFLPSIDRMLRAFTGMILVPIPEHATWTKCVVTRPASRPGGEPRVEEFTGWRLDEREGILHGLDMYGHEWEAPVSQVQVTARTLAQESLALLQMRKAEENGDRDFGRRLTRQFEPKFINTPEALIAGWSYLRGDRKTAADLLFPRLEAAKDDRWVLWAVRDLLGHLYHRPMLDHFSGRRDYAEAARLAAHLSKDLFEGYEYQPRAKELLRQLGRRTEDFKTLTLPTAEQWAEQRATMSRDDQIRFLAGRLRLLNCFQWGQPGDVNYNDPQYPRPMAEYREVEDPRRLPTVINPYVELRRLKLTIPELPVLVPYLADEDYLPTYSFWRSFHPSRTLHQVNWAVAKVVNDTALRDLADLDAYERLHRTGKQEHLKKILEWCRAHAATPRSELLMAVIRTAPKFENLTRQAAEAFEANVPGAFDALAGRMGEFPDRREEFAELCQTTHVRGAIPLARSWLKESSKELRLYAGLILLRGDEADRRNGVAALNKILRTEGFDLLPYAIDDLLAAKTPETDELALLALPKPEGRESSFHESVLLRRLFLRGLPQCRDHILSKLDSDKPVDGGYVVGDEMAYLLSDWTGTLKFDSAAAPDARRKVRLECSRWVREQFARIEKGEKPQMKTDLEPLRRSRWMVDAP